MTNTLGDRVWKRQITRRDFLWLMGAAGGSAVLAGCAPNPVTGKSQLMLMSEQQEIQIDKEQSPHQFSEDYGVFQDNNVNNYLNQIGKSLSERSHRTQIPYSYRAVGANYVNAYAFPGGSIAITRGILTEIDDEAELSGLLGHEIGHVNARHLASRMSTGMLVQGVLGSAVVVAGSTKYKDYVPLLQTIGGVGAGALLAHYSRQDERQADQLGMEYMTRANYNPQGMVDLMDILRKKSKHQPNALELMFASHPMSEERYQTAKHNAATQFAKYSKAPVNRERYMDNTAEVRKLKQVIDLQQKGEKAMSEKNYQKAEQLFAQSLKKAPNDYTGLVLMSKCQVAMENPQKAEQFAEKAKWVYPTEAQGHHISGVTKLMRHRYDAAYRDFDRYERLLPGNPSTVFYKGISMEGMQNKQGAAREYSRYLRTVKQGAQAKHAYQRLQAWGYPADKIFNTP